MTLLFFATYKRPPSAPAGRPRQVFDAVLKLPRKQQAKVVEMAEGFLALRAKAGCPPFVRFGLFAVVTSWPEPDRGPDPRERPSMP